MPSLGLTERSIELWSLPNYNESILEMIPSSRRRGLTLMRSERAVETGTETQCGGRDTDQRMLADVGMVLQDVILCTPWNVSIEMP